MSGFFNQSNLVARRNQCSKRGI